MPGADATTRGRPSDAIVTSMIAVAVGAVNLALKLPGLDRQSLWLDEALTVAVAVRPLDAIVARAAGNQNPPLYGVLMHVWIAAFGSSETSIRLLPVLCSTLAAVGIFLLARRFSGLRAAVFAAVLFTAANLHVQYAREARVYALVTLLAVASSYAFLALVARPSWRRAGLLACLNGLLFHCHYVTVFVPLAQSLAVALHAPWRARAGRWMAASAAASALLALPVVPFAWRNAPRVGAYWLDAPTWRDFRHVAKRLAGERRVLYASLVLLLPAVRRALGVPLARFDRGRVLYFALAAFVPIVLAFLIGSRVPIFLDRYLVYASVPLLLLFAETLALVPVGASGAALLAVGLAVLLGPRTLREPAKDDWRGLAAAVRARHDAAASLVVIAAHEWPPFAYYWDRDAIGADDPRARLRTGGIHAVERTSEIDVETLRRVRAVAVVRTRLGAPDTSGLRAAGFGEPRAWAAVEGLDVVAHERER